MNLKLRLSIDYYIGGAAHVLVKPIVVLLGKILRRSHTLDRFERITVIKMLGGGSLVIAYPSFLALKVKNPSLKIDLVTTPAIKPFAELLSLFDDIILIRDDNPVHIALDSIRAVWRLWRCKILVDLEIHSRLSSIFTLITCARNRIGFYTDVSYWRRSLYTHLLFYNKYAPVHELYDQVSVLLGADQIKFAAARFEFLKKLPAAHIPVNPQGLSIAVAPGCSKLARERSLSSSQWIEILARECGNMQGLDLYFLGGKEDAPLAATVIHALSQLQPSFRFHNLCGRCSLLESVYVLKQVESLYCIDSSLLHLARLSGIKTVSFWGPSDPAMRLRLEPDSRDITHYVRLTCSPCVHIVDEAPCYGKNICMEAATKSHNYHGEKNPLWLARDP